MKDPSTIAIVPLQAQALAKEDVSAESLSSGHFLSLVHLPCSFHSIFSGRKQRHAVEWVSAQRRSTHPNLFCIRPALSYFCPQTLSISISGACAMHFSVDDPAHQGFLCQGRRKWGNSSGFLIKPSGIIALEAENYPLKDGGRGGGSTSFWFLVANLLLFLKKNFPFFFLSIRVKILKRPPTAGAKAQRRRPRGPREAVRVLLKGPAKARPKVLGLGNSVYFPKAATWRLCLFGGCLLPGRPQN